ncbi:MAG: peptidoglycan DD-metalloendopeptidase family protein [Ignavibacteria bacterium]
MKIFIYNISITLLLTLIVFSQEEEIKEKRIELSNLRNEIIQLENELTDQKEKEKKSFETLENYNKQLHLLNKVIINLRQEERSRQAEINRIDSRIKSIENKIDILKKNYEKYVVAVYKRGSYNELESIVNAESVRQALVRFQYLQKFAERRKVDLDELRANKDSLKSATLRLEQEKRKKQILVTEKKSEEGKLVGKVNERENILSSIRNDKEALQKTIEAKKESHEKIKSLITKLVEEAERKRREELLRRQRLLASNESGIINETELLNDAGNEYSLNTGRYDSFNELKGEMLWPLHRGQITRKFGQNRNDELNTITLNYGVDISSNGDLNVRCVADGIISAIDWIPGYGSIIIITHNDGYRTVYSHLTEIFVEESEEVNAGKVIAKIGESVDGRVLHFEIWKLRENQNPELWLAKK